MNELSLSALPHTWIFDLDGTILEHNGYLTDEGDKFLPGALEFLQALPDSDMIIILTARTSEFKDQTVNFLRKNNVRFDKIIFDAPIGERILINDEKLLGLKTSISINVKRDQPFDLTYTIDPEK